MKLNLNSLSDRKVWTEAGYRLPEYDVSAVRARTIRAPRWIHFGAGNIFRAFLGAAAQRMLNKGAMDTGVVVFEGFDTEIVEKAYRPFDNLCVGVTLKGSGSIDKEVIASVCESVTIRDDARALEIFRNPSLMMASFTITEKGYSLKFAQKDAANEPAQAAGLMGYLTKLLLERYRANAAPIALVSMDNCSHNGEKLEKAVRFVADSWHELGYADDGFMNYLNTKVSFPWTMIDKITPRPDAAVMEMLKNDGFEDADLIVTKFNTYTSAFVNAEEKEYLVIENDFPAGCLPFEQAGIYLTDRETVEKVERMKVTTCLNPLHTSLAVFGCLLGQKTIWQEMNDPDLSAVARRIGEVEGLPVVTHPGIMDPGVFLGEVLNDRLPNCFLPDTPQRIATDTSQKLSIRYGETIKAYLKENRDMSVLKAIPATIAGWLRYLMGVDDEGSAFEISPDPRLEEMRTRLSGVSFGHNENAARVLLPILKDESLFGTDLVSAGLSERILDAFVCMNAAPGCVRAYLRELRG